MPVVQAVILFLLLASSLSTFAIAQDTISEQERVIYATKMYQQVTTFFPDLALKQFDHDYAEYVSEILGPNDSRRTFDVASMALIATLNDAHTWFYDKWLEKHYGQPVGFVAYPLDGRWVVVHSYIVALQSGDVIAAIDDTPIQKYFERSRKYISSSSGRDTPVSFFDTPVLFPKRFTLTLDGNRRVTIDRENDHKSEPSLSTEGRWLTKGSIAYIKVPVFSGIGTQAQALDFFRQFHDAKVIILDVRGNPGLGDGGALQGSLMDHPYPTWMEGTAMKGGLLLRHHGTAYPEKTQLTTSEAIVSPQTPVYSGRLILLIDRGCTCACEDFVMPFKFSKRAQLVGETTFGSYSSTNFTQFENGMMLNIAAVRHTFPDGSRFEGVGISPDLPVQVTSEDLKAGRDVVLMRALELANQP